MTATLTAPPIVDQPKKHTHVRKRATTQRRSASTSSSIASSTFPFEKLLRNGFLTDAIVIEAWRNSLPTLPWEDGYRLAVDPITGETRELPLTLFDLFYETEDDIGAVFMAQGFKHAPIAGELSVRLRTHGEAKDWLVLYDTYVRWGIPAIIQPKAPDITIIPGGRNPPEGKESYVVGRDGPLPSFVIEVTSKKTRDADLTTKKEFYERLGVQEYLIIDLLPETGKDWQLIGYRLKNESQYTKLDPDTEGGIHFETIKLRFVAVGHHHIDVFDSLTGERLLTTQELKTQAEAERLARRETEEKLAKALSQLRAAGIEPLE